ncbi:hypothetical protein [Chryseobacterium profundimaris]|uniref:Quinol oxidase subunit 4 n=1 Tax=Chryseobacterium profundimaris TaxID=1387275 RepID=A0ABY1NWL6_9FLAO|nr:hypothetical protein [Chryseobacterium profundimaris]SMP20214.1 hypothetical protein SAMN06264346_105216 [Chryseobacterium profundimaris]
MKAIISTILTITVLMLFYSCSGQDEEENKINLHSGTFVNKGLQKKADSTTMPQSSMKRDTIKGDIILSDPPPKDRDQWKTRN